ncbi:hypothetical protein Ciccas_012638 [Cichlidogyrus casuarinus]|uniref:J domain-containing protein n=1 Tax=Cichlidogyrus casuarinus TaxID=1844966 RepID=A0ABD2PNB1_9PLAT
MYNFTNNGRKPVEFIDFYKLLRVHNNASFSELKKSYHCLAKKYHPDKNPDDTFSCDQFKSIKEAYEILSVQENRQNYDLIYQQNCFHEFSFSNEQPKFSSGPDDVDVLITNCDVKPGTRWKSKREPSTAPETKIPTTNPKKKVSLCPKLNTTNNSTSIPTEIEEDDDEGPKDWFERQMFTLNKLRSRSFVSSTAGPRRFSQPNTAEIVQLTTDKGRILNLLPVLDNPCKLGLVN